MHGQKANVPGKMVPQQIMVVDQQGMMVTVAYLRALRSSLFAILLGTREPNGENGPELWSRVGTLAIVPPHTHNHLASQYNTHYHAMCKSSSPVSIDIPRHMVSS